MKKYKKFILLIIGLLFFFVQQCSNTNLLPSFVCKKSEYKYLSEKVNSKNFVIDKISDKTYLYVTYDSINNYFIVNDGYNKMKLSAEGNLLINIPHPSGELPYKTHYVFTDSTICDFSKNELEIETFFKKINPATEKLETKWISIFEEYYYNASTVIYSNNDLIYFKINEGWVSLHISDNHYLEGDNITERTFENYPAKFSKLIFLKDQKSNTYSDWMSHSGSSIDKKYPNVELENFNYPEKELNYLNNKIEKISFEKTVLSETYRYTPIIAQFQGIGYYKLKKENEYIRFKEKALKYPFKFFKSDSYLNHYTIPEKFNTKTKLSFIRYSFPTNQNESKSQGLYIIKRK
ncbi:hypothetical protein [Maribacter ulvicola]|uniref:DKNYY family protein n=1 Tax=Maribacter ulvicola TaxID=228959 RepID=A0A1N6YV22_9FLAO|nr:hypothetical protein [Maribacter ulvicola]SIR18417.1 hypothetical protein SAMN05421797_107158 [Maribacter ulvicola]